MNGSVPTEVPGPSATWLKRRTPIPIIIRSVILIPVFVAAMFLALFRTHQPSYALLMASCLVLFYLVNQGFDGGYQFAFDDELMYQRPKGWRWFFRRLPWYTISFDDVSRIEAIYGGDAALKARFMPFEFIFIYGRTGAHGDSVGLYPPAFVDQSIKDFLRLLDGRCPGKLPNEVVDYMNSDRPL